MLINSISITTIILIFFTKGLSELPFCEYLQIIKLQRLLIKSKVSAIDLSDDKSLTNTFNDLFDIIVNIRERQWIDTQPRVAACLGEGDHCITILVLCSKEQR